VHLQISVSSVAKLSRKHLGRGFLPPSVSLGLCMTRLSFLQDNRFFYSIVRPSGDWNAEIKVLWVAAAIRLGGVELTA